MSTIRVVDIAAVLTIELHAHLFRAVSILVIIACLFRFERSHTDGTEVETVGLALAMWPAIRYM
jgi:hypothetical protein